MNTLEPPFNDFSGLIEHWPSVSAFAADLGCEYQAARKMKDRNSISPDHWHQLVRICEARSIEGVTFQWLAKARAGATSYGEPAE